VDDNRFYAELLRDQGKITGRLDTRYTGFNRDGNGAGAEYDPSYAAIQGPFTAALNHYVRTDLGYENDNAYEILTGRVRPWNYGSATNRYADVGETLRRAMTANRDLRVLVCCGYYDMATPYFAAGYTIAHMGLDPALRGNITQTNYECGHMMYIRHPDLKKLREDAVRLIETAAAPR
jgi:carboxypeptidase C (cathepsin A)